MKRKRASKKSGLPPGSPLYTGNKNADTCINMVVFDNQDFTIHKNITAEQAIKLQKPTTTNWIIVGGFKNSESINKLGENFGIHPLIFEDIFNTNHLPKVDDTKENMFITLKNLFWDEESKEISSEQVSMYLGNNILITFEETTQTLFQPIIDRLKIAQGKARIRQEDFLCYLLIDSIVDNYYLLLDQTEEQIEEMEKLMFEKPELSQTSDFLQLKKNLLQLRKFVYPLREEVRYLSRADSSIITDKTREYLSDVSDHLAFISQSIDNFRELIASMMDLMMANNANRMNSIMKTLTLVSTIFIPITFLSSMYGMNFTNMPELHLKYGYLGFLIVVLLIGSGMYFYMKQKRWF